MTLLEPCLQPPCPPPGCTVCIFLLYPVYFIFQILVCCFYPVSCHLILVLLLCTYSEYLLSKQNFKMGSLIRTYGLIDHFMYLMVKFDDVLKIRTLSERVFQHSVHIFVVPCVLHFLDPCLLLLSCILPPSSSSFIVYLLRVLFI